MEKKHLILIVSGFLFAVIVYSYIRKQKPGHEVIRPGDKGNEVAGLQGAITSMTGLKFDDPGAYDTQTLNAVKYYMEGCSSLKDPEKGYVDKKFAGDLYLIQRKLVKN